MQEAFEEAGVEGKVDAACLGVYSYFKVQGAEDIRPCVVAVYPVKTRRLLNKYPEEGQRRRKWFSPKKAAQKVLEPQLRELLMQFDPDGIGKAAESDRGLDSLKAKTANRPAGTPPTPARGKPGKSARRGR